MKAPLHLAFLFTTLLFLSCSDCDPGYYGEYCETQFCATDFFVGTFEGDLNCKSSKEKHYVARFTKDLESDLTLHYESGGIFALGLDLSNFIADGHEDFFFGREQ